MWLTWKPAWGCACDLAIRIDTLESSTLVSRQLSGTRQVLCVSPENIAAHGAPGNPAELTQHAVIAYSYWSGRDLAAGALVELMPQYRAGELGIYAVYPTHQHVSAKFRRLIDFLAAQLAGTGPAW